MSHVVPHTVTSHATDNRSFIIFCCARAVATLNTGASFLRECFRFVIISLFAVVPYFFGMLIGIDVVKTVGSKVVYVAAVLFIGTYLTVLPWYCVAALLLLPKDRTKAMLAFSVFLSFFIVFLI